MKTINFKIATLYLGLLLSITFSKNIFGQQPVCNYLINCILDCPTIVKIEYFDNCSQTIPCNTQTYTFLTPGGWLPSCTGCNSANLCNIVVIILSVAGNGVTGGTGYVDSSSISDSGSTSNCGVVPTNSYKMMWFYNLTEISD